MDGTGGALLQTLGFWIGLAMTLLIASAILGDHAAARVGQHVLVGAGLGYVGVLAIQHVLRPRLIAPLLADPQGDLGRWVPLALGVLLVVAGLDRSVRQFRPAALPWWRRALHAGGRLPVALLLAVGLAAGLIGTFQGTFAPQFLAAARSAFDTDAPGPALLVGVLTLLITTAALLALYGDAPRYLRDQPAAVRRVLSGWLWLGQRAVWLAAGLIFARLLASRLSLLIARVDYFVTALYATPLWSWLDAWLR
jgi:hypothetical protein